MAYLYSFLFVGIFCLLGQIIFDKTKLTPGHIVTISVILGVVLSFFNIYDFLIEYLPGGANILITNYGHLLYQAGLEGLNEGTLLDAIMNLLSKSSVTLSFALFMGVLCSLIKKHE